MTGISHGGHEALRQRISVSPYRETLTAMHCVVAMDAGVLVAMGALDGEEIKRMYVSPERHGKGLGARIYHELEQEARHRGMHVLRLEASLNAVGFYEKQGFVRVQEHCWFLGNAKITNIIMRKTLHSIG